MIDLTENVQAQYEVTMTLYEYMYAVDAADRRGIIEVFTPDGVLAPRGGATAFTASAFADFVVEMKKVVSVTQHLLGNPIVRVRGDHAESKSMFHAFHQVPGGKTTVAFGTPEEDVDVIMAGRYEDILVNDGVKWRIQQRISIIEWESWIPRSVQMQRRAYY